MTRFAAVTAVDTQEPRRSGFRQRVQRGVSAWSRARKASPRVHGEHNDKSLPLSALGTEFASLLALTYGASFKGSKFSDEDGLAICSGLPKRAYPRGGICIGRIFLTGPEPSECVVAHERRHVEQWERYGLALIGLYFLEGTNPMTNRFEIEAGLVDGGYASEEKTLRD